jgi:DNA polymerase-3 subunit delta'
MTMDTIPFLPFDRSILQRFSVFGRHGRLAHAYLFVGPEGIGKKETALAIAKMVNCEAEGETAFCDVCPSCRKINDGQHPDIIVIDKEGGESIKIAEVQDLLGRNKLKAFMARKKVFILTNIERLTLEAANAFLKTLEEPSADSLLLLITTAPDKVLDTIKSRCHTVYFSPMSRDRLSLQMRTEGGLSEAESRFLAYFSKGCWGTARQLKENGFLEEKNGWIDGFILSRPDETAVKEMLKDKAKLKRFLEVLLGWVRDALLVKMGMADDRLVHADRREDLQRFEREFTFGDLNNINASVVDMCRLLTENLNVKIPMLIIGEQLWGR